MAIIKMDHINKKFGDKDLFHDFSIKVNHGDYVSITGPSGKGKTTLLNMMGLLEKPDSGDVTICGIKNPTFISNKTKDLRRNKLSYLFQNYGLVDTDTVEQNLGYVLKYKHDTKKQKESAMQSALSKVGLDGFLKRKIYTLSGGEQQRVALAKIILKDPEIILADEPTGSLDPANRNYVLDILKMLNENGKTIVVVTHDMEVANCAKTHIEL
jgi:putative ABC transport system ATP-binding protein